MPLWLAMRGADPFPLEPGRDVTIGRGRKCDLSLYSSLLSREHARIRWEHDGPVLFDLDSLNGCFVGVDRVLRHSLRPGDMIRLGDLTLQVVESDAPPRPLPRVEDPPTDVGPIPNELETTPSTLETQILHRQNPLHGQLFAWDELEWLQEQIGDPGLISLRDARFVPDDLSTWAGVYGLAGLYRLLEVGVLTPREPLGELAHSDPLSLASGLMISPRGDKLLRQIQGRKPSWNEMAHLRHRTRQGILFRGIRAAARAYRPGGGLEDLHTADLLYELRMIYASDISKPQRETGLRRLLCTGFFAPRQGADAAAWFPEDWDARELPVEIAARGRAVLEGFRLEEDE